MLTAARPPLRRLLHLHDRIRAGTYPNARQLSAELEVHERTIYRDLDFLRDEFHAPLEFCRRRNGFYYREPTYSLPMFELTEGELLAVLLAERLLQQYRSAPFVGDLAAAFRKLTAALPDRVTIHLEHLAEAYAVHGPTVSAQEQATFVQLVRAAQEGRQVELTYWTASRDEVARRRVDPYQLLSVGGDWYLVGYCHLREDVRMFAPGRIRSLRGTGERFDRPADFRLDTYLDGSFRSVRGEGPPVQVRLRFRPAAARYVAEKTWHPSQKLRRNKDGSVELSLRVNHLLEVKRWVLSYGAECEVLGPADLRREVRKALEDGLKQYE